MSFFRFIINLTSPTLVSLSVCRWHPCLWHPCRGCRLSLCCHVPYFCRDIESRFSFILKFSLQHYGKRRGLMGVIIFQRVWSFFFSRDKLTWNLNILSFVASCWMAKPSLIHTIHFDSFAWEISCGVMVFFLLLNSFFLNDLFIIINLYWRN